MCSSHFLGSAGSHSPVTMLEGGLAGTPALPCSLFISLANITVLSGSLPCWTENSCTPASRLASGSSPSPALINLGQTGKTWLWLQVTYNLCNDLLKSTVFSENVREWVNTHAGWVYQDPEAPVWKYMGLVRDEKQLCIRPAGVLYCEHQVSWLTSIWTTITWQW